MALVREGGILGLDPGPIPISNPTNVNHQISSCIKDKETRGKSDKKEPYRSVWVTPVPRPCARQRREASTTRLLLFIPCRRAKVGTDQVT